MLDVDPWMTKENRKLWQQLILTRVYKAGMRNLTNYQSLLNCAEWKDIVRLCHMGECIDFNVSLGQLENFRGFQLTERFKKCVPMVEARGTKFTHKVIHIVVGWLASRTAMWL